MTAPPPKSNLADLTKSAEATIAQLLAFPGFKTDQWMMRLTIGNDVGDWEPMSNDTAANDRLIKERIAQSARPVTELAVGYVGMINWRGTKRPMAYLQYFKGEYEQGLLCLRHVEQAAPPGTFEGFGGFLVVGACKNIWIGVNAGQPSR